jgi:hypothetical protein
LILFSLAAGTAGRLYTKLMSGIQITQKVYQLVTHIFANARNAANQKDSTCINPKRLRRFSKDTTMDQLTQEIYTQLLELHANDLEVENTGLQLQVVALQITVGKYPVVQPNPPQWPHQYPVWTVTSTETPTVS